MKLHLYDYVVILLSLIAIVLLSACTYVEKDVVEKDYYDCSRKAQELESEEITGGTMINELASLIKIRKEIQKNIDDCMRQLGY